MKEVKKAARQCCYDENDIIECLCALDNEIECIKNSIGHKYFNRVAKEKVLLCILLHKIGKLDKKLDKILYELDYGWSTSSENGCECE